MKGRSGALQGWKDGNVHKTQKNKNYGSLFVHLCMEAETLAVLALADNPSFKSGGLATRTSSSSSAVVQVASQGWSSGNASTFGERQQLHGEGETGEQKQAKANSQRFCNRVACDIADKADALHAALLSLACQLEAGTGAPGAETGAGRDGRSMQALAQAMEQMQSVSVILESVESWPDEGWRAIEGGVPTVPSGRGTDGGGAVRKKPYRLAAPRDHYHHNLSSDDEQFVKLAEAVAGFLSGDSEESAGGGEFESEGVHPRPARRILKRSVPGNSVNVQDQFLNLATAMAASSEEDGSHEDFASGDCSPVSSLSRSFTQRVPPALEQHHPHEEAAFDGEPGTEIATQRCVNVQKGGGMMPGESSEEKMDGQMVREEASCRGSESEHDGENRMFEENTEDFDYDEFEMRRYRNALALKVCLVMIWVVTPDAAPRVMTTFTSDDLAVLVAETTNAEVGVAPVSHRERLQREKRCRLFYRPWARLWKS